MLDRAAAGLPVNLSRVGVVRRRIERPMRDALKAAQKAQPRDTLVLFLSGHGTSVDGRYFFLTRYLGRASYARDKSRRQLLRPGEREVIPLGDVRMVSRRFAKGSRLAVATGSARAAAQHRCPPSTISVRRDHCDCPPSAKSGGECVGRRRRELVVRDDKLNPGEAATRTLELVEKEKVNFVVGSLSAAVQLAINNVTK